MGNLNIKCSFKKFGQETKCYVLVENNKYTVVNEIVSLKTFNLFKCSPLSVSIYLIQKLDLELCASSNSQFKKDFREEVKRALIEFNTDFSNKKTIISEEDILGNTKYRIMCSTTFEFDVDFKNEKRTNYIKIKLVLNEKDVQIYTRYVEEIMDLKEDQFFQKSESMLGEVGFIFEDYGLTGDFRTSMNVYTRFRKQLIACFKNIQKNLRNYFVMEWIVFLVKGNGGSA